MAKDMRFDQSILKAPMHALQRLSVSAVAAGVLAVAGLSACTTTDIPTRPAPRPAPQTPAPVQPTPETPDTSETPETQTPDLTSPDVLLREGLTPPHMRGRPVKRLALLLPFSAKSTRLRAEAASMMNAAEMAVFARPTADVVLIALDTQGTPSGTQAASRAAVNSGADVILGPILAGSVKAAAQETARSRTPLIAFSTDQNVAGNGTYLLSFPPEAEVNRIVDYVRETGAQRFAFLGPQNAYGERVFDAYQSRIRQNQGELVAAETYDGNDITVMQEPAQKIAQFYQQRWAAGQDGAQSPLPFDAIILPEGGTPLRSLAPLLTYYDDELRNVQLLGTGRWQSEDSTREPALYGGIFAGPDQEGRRAFRLQYDNLYQEEAASLASLAYDAVGIGAVIADGDPRGRRARAEDPSGFYGVDGLIRFNADGTPDRGLAVYEVQGGRFNVIDPAPRTVTGPS